MNKNGVIICDEHIRFVGKRIDSGCSPNPWTGHRRKVNYFEVDHQNGPQHKMRFYKMIDYQDQYEDHLMCGLSGIGPVYLYSVSLKIKYVPVVPIKEQRIKKLKNLKRKSLFRF